MMNNELKMQNEKIIPNGVKLTDMGVIPEDWCCIQAKELINFLGGFAFSSKSAKDSGIRWLKIANVGLNEIKWDAEAFLPQSYLSTYQDYELKHGDVVMALTRPILGHRLKIAQLKKSDVPSLLNQRVAKLTPKIEGCLPFIYHLVQSSDFIAAMNLAMAGSDPPNIGAHSLGEILIRAPFAVKEQAAIAGILSDTDILITEIEQLIAKKEAIKTATMQQLLTGRTRLPQFAKHSDGTLKDYKSSKLGLIPEDWQAVTLGYVTQKIVGGGTPSRANPNYWGNDIPWVTVKDFATFISTSAQEFITRNGLANSSSNLIPRGTLITSTRMALGKAVIYDVDVAINQDLKAIFTNEYTTALFLFYWFEHNTRKFEELGSGSTVKGLALNDLKGLDFLLMSIDEQMAITTILSDMDAELTVLEQKLSKIRDIKQGMMQQLLTGRIRLPLEQQP